MPEHLQNYEDREKLKYGANVIIHNFWQRHSQKQSAQVFNAEKTGISNFGISEAGVERAKVLGGTISASIHGAKGYRSNALRTQETFDAMMEGYSESNPEVPVRETVRFKEELVAAGDNKQFLDLFDSQWDANKKKLMQIGVEQGKYPDVAFSELSPDQQEEISEEAEEPVMREWVDDPTSALAQAYPPRDQAVKFAKLFNRRHERMAQKLPSGSEVDLFHVTHKSVTEPFLASGVLVRKSDGVRITKLADIGGSLKILDNWESEIKTNSEGKSEKVVKIRGQEFLIDDEFLQKLLEV